VNRALSWLSSFSVLTETPPVGVYCIYLPECSFQREADSSIVYQNEEHNGENWSDDVGGSR
jgi:hypothetical protein